MPIQRTRIKVGRLTLDRSRFQARYGEVDVPLTAKEFAILWTLASDAEKVFPREDLLTKVWGPELCVTIRTIDAHIKKLRKKLRVVHGASVIQTVRGVGYRFREPQTAEQS
jgi:two-component system alkaline phosphatase synthesis response regulator PhoP